MFHIAHNLTGFINYSLGFIRRFTLYILKPGWVNILILSVTGLLRILILYILALCIIKCVLIGLFGL